MSITPVEENDGGKNREPARNERPGVRARLQSWLGAVSQRIRDVFTPAEDERETETRSGEIRVAQERKLATQRDSPIQSESRDGPPPARGTLPGSAVVDTEQNGETLRVYNPQHEEAFISSDTWMDIER